MNLYESLLDVARVLLAADQPERVATVLLQRVVAATQADRGFVVAREGPTYEEKFDVAFAKEERSTEVRRWSRSLVRDAMREGVILHSSNIAVDPRYAAQESSLRVGANAVLVAPLVAETGEIEGALYLERATASGGFSAEARRFVEDVAKIGAASLQRGLRESALRERARTLERDLFAQYDFAGIVTRAPSMVALLETVAQVADTQAPVLLRGETGTGKELVAHALHANSARRSRPFVTVHCAALPGSMLESELFGHVRGAFTGALKDRTGRLPSADGGTLFLDEVGELSLETQAKLLRFLQFGEVQRVGSDRIETVDARVVAATHRDLASMVKAGQFREDLYYRLHVVELVIPPLRERAGDIPILVEHFLSRSWRRPAEPPTLTPRATMCLRSHAYPGNVRELAHAIERACLLARGSEITEALLPPEMASVTPAALPAEDVAVDAPLTHAGLEALRERAVEHAERRFLDALMKHHDGNVSRAARESGLHRSYLHKLIARYR